MNAYLIQAATAEPRVPVDRPVGLAVRRSITISWIVLFARKRNFLRLEPVVRAWGATSAEPSGQSDGWRRFGGIPFFSKFSSQFP
jgi:hypothetical protein